MSGSVPIQYFHGGGDWGVVYSDGSVRRDVEALREWREHCEREADRYWANHHQTRANR